MAKTKHEQEKEQPEGRNQPQQDMGPEGIAEPPVPDGMDEACFHQGWLAGKEHAKAEAGKVFNNPFVGGTHQGDSWQAGFDAFGAAITPPEPPLEGRRGPMDYPD